MPVNVHDPEHEAVRALLDLSLRGHTRCLLVLFTPLLRQHPTNGFPVSVLENEKWAEALPIVIETDVLGQMMITFHEAHMSCRLSFDRLYDVEIPYGCIGQITNSFPLAATSTPAPTSRPAPLRLVPDDDLDN